MRNFSTLFFAIPIFILHISNPSKAQTRDKLDAFIKTKMMELQIPGMQVAVVQAGRIIFNKSFGFANLQDSVPVTDKSVFAINSCTKSFTGVAIMQLVEEGKIDLQAPISKYVDELPPEWRPVTIKQLLTHVSGLPDIVSLRNPSTNGYGESSEAAIWEKVKKKCRWIFPRESNTYTIKLIMRY